jgi:hypothetical protein
VPRGLEPSRKRCSRFVKNRTCTDRGLVPTSGAYQPAPSLTPWYRLRFASRADESLWPAQVFEVGGTCLVIGEHHHELTVCPRIVVPRNN